MKPITADEIGTDLRARAIAMREWAHLDDHHIDIVGGETATSRFPVELRHAERLAGWETKVWFVYSVDIVPLAGASLADAIRTGDRRRMRHLSVSISVPSIVTQGDLNATEDAFASLFEPIARTFFPLHDQISKLLVASDPIPVARTDVDGVARGNVHFRTPVTVHFFVDHDSMEGVAGVERTGRVRDFRIRD